MFVQVRCNGIRALGIFLKIIDVPDEGNSTASLVEDAISIIAKQATTGNFMKVLHILCLYVHSLISFSFRTDGILVTHAATCFRTRLYCAHIPIGW